MKCLVTGGAGFIGSHVAERLVSAGHEVLVLDDLSGGVEANVPRGAVFIKGSVCAPEVDGLFQEFKPAWVFHLAAYAAEGLSHHIPVFNFRNNLEGTANVLAAAHRAGVKHFVFTSSIAVYGHGIGRSPFFEDTEAEPVDPYGIAKLACEQHIKAAARYHRGPNWTIFRPHNVFGELQNISDPYRNVVGIFARCARLGQPMPIFGDGAQTRSFSYIDQVAAAIADAPTNLGAVNQIINIGGDEVLSVRELARAVSEAMGVEEKLAFLLARAEVQAAHCDHAKARRIFSGMTGLSVAEGLKRMAAWVRSLPEIPPPTPCPSPIEIEDNLPPSWRT